MTVTVDGTLGITTPAINISGAGVIQLSGTSDLGISTVDPLTDFINFDAFNYVFNGTDLGKTAYFVNTSTNASPYRGLMAMYLTNAAPANRVIDMFCDTANHVATIDFYDWKWFIGNSGAGGQGLLSSVGGILTYSGSKFTLTSTTPGGTLSLQASGATAQTLTFPATSGSAGNVLTTDGAGNLSWAAAGTSTPAGATTQVQYNNAGAFGANAGLTYTSGTQTLYAANTNTNVLQIMDSGSPFGSIQLSGGSVLSISVADTSTDSINFNANQYIFDAANLGKTAYFVNKSTDANPYRGLIGMFLNNTAPTDRVIDMFCDTSANHAATIDFYDWKWFIGNDGVGGQGLLSSVGGDLTYSGGSLTLSGSTSGSTKIQAAAVAGAPNTLTLPTVNGTLLASTATSVANYAVPYGNAAGQLTQDVTKLKFLYDGSDGGESSFQVGESANPYNTRCFGTFNNAQNFSGNNNYWYNNKVGGFGGYWGAWTFLTDVPFVVTCSMEWESVYGMSWQIYKSNGTFTGQFRIGNAGGAQLWVDGVTGELKYRGPISGTVTVLAPG